MKRARATGMTLALLLAGCADVGRRAAITPEEYSAYRRYRFAPTVLGKLGSGYTYLARYSRGPYGDEVRGWMDPASRVTLARAWNDASGLQAFLHVVRSGKNADLASRRLLELELTAQYRARRDTAFDEKIRGIESKLAAAESGRRELLGGFVGWIRALASLRSFGGTAWETDGAFNAAYRLAEPAPHCTEDGCSKPVTVQYSVPEGKTQSDRLAVYDVVVSLEKGVLHSTWVTGPELFTRIGEAASVRAVAPSDFVGRAEAIGQATQLLAGALEPLLPAATCAKDAVSPVVLERACDGVRLRVISATMLGEEDRVVIEAGPPAPASSPSAATAPGPSPSPAPPRKQ